MNDVAQGRRMRAEDYSGPPAIDEQLRQPPHSLEAEQAVLGGLMLDAAGAWPQVEMLAGVDFFNHQHQQIYAAIGALVAERQPVDMITVGEQLSKLDQLDTAGGHGYLLQLTVSVPSAANVGGYAEIVRERAVLREQIAVADAMTSAAFNPSGRSALALAEAAQRRLIQIAAHAGPRAAPFKLVDLKLLGDIEPAAQQWFWDTYVPAGFLTLLNGHGGSLKTTFSLALACCMAVGEPYLGRATRRARVLFFSGEDPEDLVLRRVDRICRTLGLDTRHVRERLVIVDATDFDPVLFFDQRSAERSGRTTPTYEALARLVEERGIEVLIVDNASDVFEGDEIKRSSVRAFMRALVALVRARGGAVLLLAHVDKVTSRNGKAQQSTETYSGSTAWHNTARSRLYLSEVDPGRFELQHQKCNVGPRQETIATQLIDGVLQLPPATEGEPGGATAQRAVDASDTRALLRLIAEFGARGEFVGTASNSPQNAARLLGAEKTFPKRATAEVFWLIRNAERDGLLARDKYRTDGRKTRERWDLTTTGYAFANLPAPSAPSAPSV